MSAMQQIDRASALAFAVKFSAILFLEEHSVDCDCSLLDTPLTPRERVTTLHRRKCKIVKRGVCTCRPVFVHAPVRD